MGGGNTCEGGAGVKIRIWIFEAGWGGERFGPGMNEGIEKNVGNCRWEGVKLKLCMHKFMKNCECWTTVESVSYFSVISNNSAALSAI